jgi:peptidyl-prolyl cis-trans isomerase SurA
MSIRDSIVKQNLNFGEMAVRHSQDPSAKANKGDLGYFTAFNMVYPFESAAYNTPVGKVSLPVRTQYGYHIIQVQDRFKGKGIQYASHIIIRVGENYSAKDTASAIARIQEIYARLKKGEDFATLAEQFSDDPGSAKTGGDLGAARLLAEMEVWKRKLNIGEFSEPFTTPFGWHILKMTKSDPIPSFEDSQAEIKSRVQKDQRSNLPQEVFMDKLRKEYNPIILQPTADQFIATLGKEYSQGKVTKTALANSIKTTNWEVGDIIIYWAANPNAGGSSHKYGHTQIYTGGILNKSASHPWATSNATNYKTQFVYNSIKSDDWYYYIFKAPKPSKA